MRTVKLLFILVVVVLLANPFPSTAQQAAYWPTAGWRTSTPEEQGMNSAELAEFFKTWSQEQFRLDSVLVIRHGYIVGEAYAQPNKPTIKHHMYDMSVNVTNTLIGIAIQEGYLKGVDELVLDQFPKLTVKNVDANKKALTIRHLLTMQSGFECPTPSPWAAMVASKDWVQFALDLPMAAKPGTQFNFCHGPGTHILSAIITEKTGMSALDYAAKKLFGPLGITDYAWASSPTGITTGFGDLQLSPRDIAKIGYLYLRNGEWDGKQLIPADYAKASITKQVGSPWPDTAYGYGWWVAESRDNPAAIGFAGQYIGLVYGKDMLQVMTGGFTENIRIPLQAYPIGMMFTKLTAADKPSAEDAAGAAQFKTVLAAINAPAPKAVPVLPKVAQQISDQPYTLVAPLLLQARGGHGAYSFENGLAAQAFTLKFGDSSEAALKLVLADNKALNIPVGLDGLYRVSEGQAGMLGAKGEWLTADTFRVYLKYIGDTYLSRVDFTFIPGGVEIIQYEYANGMARAVQGMMAQQS